MWSDELVGSFVYPDFIEIVVNRTEILAYHLIQDNIFFTWFEKSSVDEYKRNCLTRSMCFWLTIWRILLISFLSFSLLLTMQNGFVEHFSNHLICNYLHAEAAERPKKV